MARLDTAETPSITLEEVANDGSDLTNPNADHRRLFLGEDGTLHLKDSSGTVTGITATVADHNHTASAGDGGDLDAPIIDGHAIFNEESAPSTPASGTVAVYAKSDGLMYSKDDAGAETLMSGGAGGGGGSHTTAGTTSAGGSWDGPTAKTYLKSITLANDAMLMSVVAHLRGNNANPGAIGAAVYTNSGGAPVNVIALSRSGSDSGGTEINNLQMNTTARWVRLPMGFWLTAGTYWLAFSIAAGTAGAIDLAYTGSGSDKTQAHGPRAVDISIVGTSNTTDNFSFYADLLEL